MARRVGSRLSLSEADKTHVNYIIKEGASQIALRRFSDWDVTGRLSVGSKVRRKDAELHCIARDFTESTMFDNFIMISIMLNALFMALETDYNFKHDYYTFLETADELFLAIYTMEFALKLYVHPIDYWSSGYNVFDAFVLLMSYIPLLTPEGGVSTSLDTIRIFRACRSLRVLKTVSFIRGLQALIAALFKTMKSLTYVLALMVWLMFIFAVIGHEYYGDVDTGDPENWGDIGSAFFTLFSLVTVDGWTALQSNLDDLGLVSSRPFTIVFILLSYFILFNMFGGVVIMEIHHATQRFEQEVRHERDTSLAQKKHAVVQRQKDEVRELIHTQKGSEDHYKSLIVKFKKSLRHSDVMLMEEFCTTMSFIDIYFTSMDLQDKTAYRLQHLYGEVLRTLAELLEQDLLDQAEEEQNRQRKLDLKRGPQRP
ncbi:cation channel sperm-associated protein 3-like [Engraulis encrasicolus]|uniref:cation channel sperm-associated protein 3-like n=1 Tax=Engraulis encrasicolus TaxID=184585 RepID=UPI002FD3C277